MASAVSFSAALRSATPLGRAGARRRGLLPRGRLLGRGAPRPAAERLAGRLAYAAARTVVSSSSSSASSRHWASTSRSLIGVPVGGQPEVDLAVVGRHADGQQVAGGQRQHRIAGGQPGPGRVQRHLRAGHVGDHQVVRLAHHLGRDPYAERVQRGRREPGDVGQRPGSHRPAGVLVGLGGVRDLVQPHQRVRLADRQALQVRRDLAAQRGRLAVVLGDTHRHQRGQRAARADRLAPGQQPGPQAAGDHRQHHVVDGVLVLARGPP